jgi:hypothetical protein
LYFGVGAAGTVDRIEVAWPSGKKQTMQGPVATNATIEITER